MDELEYKAGLINDLSVLVNDLDFLRMAFEISDEPARRAKVPDLERRVRRLEFELAEMRREFRALWKSRAGNLIGDIEGARQQVAAAQEQLARAKKRADNVVTLLQVVDEILALVGPFIL